MRPLALGWCVALFLPGGFPAVGGSWTMKRARFVPNSVVMPVNSTFGGDGEDLSSPSGAFKALDGMTAAEIHEKAEEVRARMRR